MTLYIANSTDLKQISSSRYNLAVVYQNEVIYTKIKTAKVLINKDGNIEKENYFKHQKVLNKEVLKQLAFRTMLVSFSCEKAYMTIDTYGKRKSSMNAMINEQVSPMKNVISNVDDTKYLIELLGVFSKKTYSIFLQTAEYHKGKKFIKLFDEALLFLWNITKSLFSSYLYHTFDNVIEYYQNILSSYIYFFCVDFIKKIGIDMEYVDSNYQLNEKSIKLIYKLFNEKIHKLHQHKRGNIDTIIKSELQELEMFTEFTSI